MANYLIQCYFDTAKKHRIDELRKEHLVYIGSQMNMIGYGGVGLETSGSYNRIVYVLKDASLEQASAFAANDPYRPLYADIEIIPFMQKIPQQ